MRLCVCLTKTLNTDIAQIGGDIEPTEAPREDVDIGNEEDEEPLEAEFHRATMNPKNPTSREQQQHEDSGHAVYRSCCAACVEGRGVGGQHRIELLEDEERERTSPIVAFDHDFLTGKRRHVSNSDLSRQAGMVKLERHVVNGIVPQHTPYHFLCVSSKIFVLRRFILKCDHEPSAKSIQDAVIQACVGVEVIPQVPFAGDHMANGRVEMAVREVGNKHKRAHGR